MLITDLNYISQLFMQVKGRSSKSIVPIIMDEGRLQQLGAQGVTIFGVFTVFGFVNPQDWDNSSVLRISASGPSNTGYTCFGIGFTNFVNSKLQFNSFGGTLSDTVTQNFGDQILIDTPYNATIQTFADDYANTTLGLLTSFIGYQIA